MKSFSILLLVPGIKGAVGSTVAMAATLLQQKSEKILPYLTTADMFSEYLPSDKTFIAGWDRSNKSLAESVVYHGVLPDEIWNGYERELDQIHVYGATSTLSFKDQVEKLENDILEFKAIFPETKPVLVNLLPACGSADLSHFNTVSDLYDGLDPSVFPDMAYIIAAIRCGVPIANFTSNPVESPLIAEESVKYGVPISGRDGKTGQTYLKVVLASALKARNLFIDGWYSLNILGNQDGENLSEPCRASEKLKNKTNLLDEIVGYKVGAKYGKSTHKVHIDYYPPRGDSKEAWDAIDISGIFGLGMSIRLNFLARDSVLAAPLVIDLARWMAILQITGRSGFIPELGFYYKKPLGDNPPLTFQDQLYQLKSLETECNAELLRRKNEIF